MEKDKVWLFKYIGGCVIGAVVIFLYIIGNIHPFYSGEELIYSVLFSAGIVIADNFPIIYFPGKQNKAELTISLPLAFAGSFILSPVYAICTVIVGNIIAEIIVRKRKIFKNWYKTLFNTAYLTIVAGLTSLFFFKFFDYNSEFFSIKNVFVLTAGGMIYFLLETIILFILLSHLNNENFFTHWIKNIKFTKSSDLMLFPLGYLIMYLYTENFWITILLIPLFIAIYLASKEKVKIIEQTEKTLFTLAQIEDDKFPDTKKHSDRVGNLVEELTSVLKLSEDDADIIIKAAKLHDIGKIAIPDKILEKPGELTKEEWKIIKTHTEKGAQIVKELSPFEKGANIILHHHERWDGKGYPNKLKGEEIPLGSRIISLADSFDAMISYRTYRDKNSKNKRKTIKEALKEIKNNSGAQFDPKISKLFCEIIEELVAKSKSQEVKLNKKFHWTDYFPEDAQEE